ncbi:IucA/IucC family protein [Staphylococcus coagulans]|uniref:IucA/IucC family protein n=2 Tax=Staphylococcus coagulans TaxID=74706 RepID=A0ABU1EVQ9_9STAP|nr:IucA/IucC family protein [Staphylococcus coagulans]MDR5601993.1 IucA/IucC family protein [Staphylococcus coagulans]
MNKERNQQKTDILLTKDEQECFQTLVEIDSNWAQLFKENILSSRDKITARLMASIYRENLVGGFDHCEIKEAQHFQNCAIPAGQLLCIHFTYTGRTLFAKIKGQHAFNRIDLEGPFYWYHESSEDERVLHPNEILDVIIQEDTQYDGEAAKQFRDDLENSAAHMALALSYQAQHSLNDFPTLLDYIEAQNDRYLTSEQLVIEGHPVHPGAKLRKGMTAKETICYSSEYQHGIPMQFILIHRDYARTMSAHSNYAEVVYDAFEGLKEAAQNQLEGSSQSLNNYVPLIVHPWQYAHIITEEYQDAISQQIIVPLSYQQNYYAGLSFRTLMPEKPEQTPHIKLSTNVHITGEIRTLSEQTTHNGPLMTNILTHIAHNDPLFKDVATQAVPELAGAHFYNPNDKNPAYQEQRSEQLGTLYRENIYDLLDDNALPLIPSSFVVNKPSEHRTLVIELIERFAAHQGRSVDMSPLCQDWFSPYARALIDYVVPLLVKYGIALEAHLQNTIAVFDDRTGAFQQMLIRDFEGLRIDQHQLSSMGYDTSDFHEKSRILTESQTSVFNKAFYSTIQNHLGEIVAAIAHYYKDEQLENKLWQIVQTQIQQCFERIKQTQMNQDRINSIYHTFFNPVIDYKCVTTMRLIDEAHHYTYIKVDNPLHMTSE